MKTFALLLIAVFTLNSSGAARQSLPPPASSQTQDGTVQVARAKAEVKRRGMGEKSRVRVRLRDGTEVRGYISKIEESSFAVTDQSGTMTSIRYDDARDVHGEGMSKTAKILIVVGIVGALIGTGAALACHSEGGPHC